MLGKSVHLILAMQRKGWRKSKEGVAAHGKDGCLLESAKGVRDLI